MALLGRTRRRGCNCVYELEKQEARETLLKNGRKYAYIHRSPILENHSSRLPIPLFVHAMKR